MSFANHLRDWVVEGTVVGATGYGLTMLVAGNNSMNIIGNHTVAGVIGAASAAGSIIGDAAHDYVFPHLAANEKWSTIESSLFSAGVAAAAGIGAVALVDSNVARDYWMEIGIYAIGADIIGEYLSRSYVQPMLENMSWYKAL